jgi:hypothetical protein
MNGVPIALGVAALLGGVGIARRTLTGSRDAWPDWWWLESWDQMEVYDSTGRLVARTDRGGVPQERVFSYSRSLSENHARYVYAKKWIKEHAVTNGYLLMLGMAHAWGRPSDRRLYQFGPLTSTLWIVKPKDYSVTPTLDGSRRLVVRQPAPPKGSQVRWPCGWFGPEGSSARARSTLMQRMIPGEFRVVLFDESGLQVPTRGPHHFRLFVADPLAAQENIALGEAARAWRDATLPLAEGTVALLPTQGPGLRGGFAHAFMYFLKARSTLDGVEFRYLFGRPRFMPTLDGTERLIDPKSRHGWEHATTRRFRFEGDRVLAIELRHHRKPRRTGPAITG